MPEKHIPRKDRLMATAIGGLSTACYISEFVTKKITYTDCPGYAEVDWQTTRIHRDDVHAKDGSAWATFDPDPSAGRFPKDWPTVGLIRADYAALMWEDAQYHDAFIVAAFTVGKAVMIGGLSGAVLSGRLPKDNNHNRDDLLFGMRVGPGAPLEATVGIYDEANERLTVPRGGVEAVQTILTSQVDRVGHNVHFV